MTLLLGVRVFSSPRAAKYLHSLSQKCNLKQSQTISDRPNQYEISFLGVAPSLGTLIGATTKLVLGHFNFPNFLFIIMSRRRVWTQASPNLSTMNGRATDDDPGNLIRHDSDHIVYLPPSGQIKCSWCLGRNIRFLQEI